MEASFPEGGSFFGVREEEDQNQMQQQQHSPKTPSSSTTPPAPPPQKKRRNQPGTPNPDAEIIALSPKTLMTTNRFTCEVCNKGFQREQNLQLHRRGHNLPWKLKQKNTKEPKKIKVYLCPEPTCAHHDPSRALGDLTGIKKHYFRKHGEKKWRCERCSKKYAVQSDWKAHSKICGTKEYRCDCGTLFSRRDSFITHRAFCDALTQESATQPLPPPPPPPPSDLSHGVINNGSQLYGTASTNMSLGMAPIIHDHQSSDHYLPFSDHNTTLSHQTMHSPTFFMPDPTQPQNYHNDPTPVSNNNFFNNHPFFSVRGNNCNNNLYFSEPNFNDETPNFFSSNWCHQTVPHMSATALLHKAAQMGATSSTTNNNAAPTAASSLLRSYANSAASASSSKSIQELMNTSVFETRIAGEKVSVGGSDRLTRDFLGVGHEIVRSMSGGGVSVRQREEEEHGGFGISPLEEVRNAGLQGDAFGDGGNF